MSSTVERYLEVAVGGVARGERDDARRELREAIEEGVREKAEEGLDEAAAVEAVLTEFGDPLRFAARYRGRPLGLISGARYPLWRTLVRLLLGILVPLGAVVTFAGLVTRGVGVPGIVIGVVVAAVQFVVHVTFWTTLALALVDRRWPAPEPEGPERGSSEVPWSTAYLPLGSGGARPDRAETLLWAGTAVVGVALPLAQLFVSPVPGVPFLNPAGWSLWWPLVIVALALHAPLAFAVHRKGWTARLAAVALVLDLAIMLPPLGLLVAGQAVNPAFLEALHWPAATPPGDALVAGLLLTVAAVATWRIIGAVRRLLNVAGKDR